MAAKFKFIAKIALKILSKKEVQEVMLKTAEDLAKKTENKVDDKLVEIIKNLREWINGQ